MSESDSMFPGLEATVAPPPQAAVAAPPGRARLKPVGRRQMMMRPVDVERLIEEDHPARAIWDFVGQLDLSSYKSRSKQWRGWPGVRCGLPRLLISLWIYAYSRGIGSAREISRRLAYEPAFQWLAGLAVINYHTLSDFRVAFEQPLNELFANSLGVMSAEGLVSLERVEQNLEKTPEQLVTDGGFTNRQNILECADKGIDFIGSFPHTRAIGGATQAPGSGAGVLCASLPNMTPSRIAIAVRPESLAPYRTGEPSGSDPASVSSRGQRLCPVPF